MPSKRIAKRKTKQLNHLPRILVLAGIVLLVAVVWVIKNQPVEPTAAASPADASAEELLDFYLAEGKPTLTFFHSNTCHSCIVMMEIVAQVYPEFEDTVGLVDVDVYDSNNNSLLRRAGIQSIPTLVFIDRHGEGQVSIGVIDSDQLRQQLAALLETP